jgi:hypothetical protein
MEADRYIAGIVTKIIAQKDFSKEKGRGFHLLTIFFFLRLKKKKLFVFF